MINVSSDLRRPAVWALVAVLAATPAMADRRPMREARSKSGDVLLRIIPGRPGRAEGGECRGILMKHERGAGTHEVWSRPLVNEICPMLAFVRDDARFVVTLDEYRRGGAAHAVVVYDADGKPLREFTLAELLPGEDMRHVERDDGALEWLKGAKFEFDKTLPQFVITLKWEREIRIDLERLEIVGREHSGAQTARREGSPTSAASDTLAAQSGEMAAAVAQIEQLIKDARALEGKTFLSQQAPAEAAAQASQAAGEAARQAIVEAMAKADPARRHAPDELMIQKIEELAYVASNDGEPLLGTAAVNVPMPQPGDPVDYVAWTNTFTQTDGPSAAPLFEAASEATVRSEFPDDLLARALDGDPDALADPAVTEWLAANADALADFREATGYEFNGYQMHSDDGTMIGMLLPTLGNLRELTRASAVEARIAEANGDLDAAADSYLTTFAAGGQARRGVTLIEDLVGVAMERMAGDGLLDMYARDTDGAIDYSAMVDRFDHSRVERRPMVDTVQFERASALDIIQHVYDVNPDTGNYRVSEDGIQTFQGLIGGAAADSLGAIAMGFQLGQIGFERMTEDANHYYDDLTHAMQAPDYPAARQQLSDLETETQSSDFQSNPVMSQLAPSLSRAYQLDVQAQTNRHAIDTITRLRAYRQQYGEYPDSLDGLAAGNAVIDPLSGAPFVYYRDGDDFVLYSVGANGTDEGGVHDSSGQGNDLKYWPRPKPN